MSVAIQVKAGSESEESRRKEAGVSKGEKEKVELDGRKSFFQLRKSWSRWIIFWISILIIFNITLTGLVGFKFLSFQNYRWFITTVTIETFLQTVGMGYVAVRYLFSD
jgi:hypothetical protein